MCKWCENGECLLRGGIADDCSCDGDISEQIECNYTEIETEVQNDNS